MPTDPNAIPLGGEWRDGKREYAPGLWGFARLPKPGSSIVPHWELETLALTEGTSGLWRLEGAVVPSPALGQQALLRLAESACDHAARTFLAGCLAYALPLLAGELEGLAGEWDEKSKWEDDLVLDSNRAVDAYDAAASMLRAWVREREGGENDG